MSMLLNKYVSYTICLEQFYSNIHMPIKITKIDIT